MAHRNCHNCGAPIRVQTRSCGHCGGPLHQAHGRPTDIAAQRVATGVCALILGSLGVHKFMLGQVGCGVILLLLGFVTCFTVSSVIGIAEGIIILTKSDEDFERIYLIGRRPWF